MVEIDFTKIGLTERIQIPSRPFDPVYKLVNEGSLERKFLSYRNVGFPNDLILEVNRAYPSETGAVNIFEADVWVYQTLAEEYPYADRIGVAVLYYPENHTVYTIAKDGSDEAQVCMLNSQAYLIKWGRFSVEEFLDE